MWQDKADVLVLHLARAHHPIGACGKRGDRAWLDINGRLAFEQSCLPAIILHISRWDDIDVAAEESGVQRELKR